MDLRLAYQWVVDELAAKRPIDRAMNLLIDHCSLARQHESWDELRVLAVRGCFSIVRMAGEGLPA